MHAFEGVGVSVTWFGAILGLVCVTPYKVIFCLDNDVVHDSKKSLRIRNRETDYLYHISRIIFIRDELEYK